MKRLDLVEQIFGKLRVLGLSEISRNGHSRWHVVCECGTEKTVLGTHLVSGKVKTCGVCSRRRRNWKGYKEVSLTYYTSVKRGAGGGKGRKPIDFNLTIEYIGDLLEAQNYKCSLSGLPIDVSSKTASLDRIDSSKGYIEGNLQWLHKDINMMKRHYSEDYFIYLCKLVSGDSCGIVDLT